MPLPTALKKWISDCKDYAAKHNCSYKQAMTALKKLKKSRKSHQSGGHSDLNGSNIETFEGASGMQSANKPVAADGGTKVPPPVDQVHPPPPAAVKPMSGGAGMDLFAVGAVGQTGGRRRRRRSGSKSKRHGQNQNQNQNGGKRRKSRRGPGRRRRSSRGGSALSYSQY